jgi:nucleobase:cation symporter-1, NCS1 family
MDIAAETGQDAFLKVETRGIEAVPESARHGRPRDLALFWAGGFVDYASILTASLLTSFFGLGVWDGLLAVLTGTVSAALILGLLSTTTVRTGLPQVVTSRLVFGRVGMKVAAFLTLFLAIGWFAVDSVIATQAGVQLLVLAGLGSIAGKLAFPLLLVISAISVMVAVFGHATIHVFERFGAVVFGGLLLVLFLALAGQFHWTTGPSVSGPNYPGAFLLGFMVCFALVASWFPFAGDYSRYLPRRSRPLAVTLWPVAGITGILLLLGLFGLLLPTIDPTLAADPSGGVLAVIAKHAPAAVALPFFVLVILGEIWANYLDAYTAGLCVQALGVRLERWQTALGCGLLSALLATYAIVVKDFHTAYEEFLLLGYLWAPAWAGVVLLAFYAARPGRILPAAVAWAIGAAAGLLFVNYPNTFPGIHVFNQPLIDALHQADLSGLVSVLVGAGGYLVLRRVWS